MSQTPIELPTYLKLLRCVRKFSYASFSVILPYSAKLFLKLFRGDLSMVSRSLDLRLSELCDRIDPPVKEPLAEACLCSRKVCVFHFSPKSYCNGHTRSWNIVSCVLQKSFPNNCCAGKCGLRWHCEA